MKFLLATQLFALASILFAVTMLALRVQRTRALPFAVDHSPAKGSPQNGVLYAFTLGMAPWAKESTRRHMIAYLRGILFHIGVFVGLFALVTSPWWSMFPMPIRWLLAITSGLGALAGLSGEFMRWLEHNLRALSTLDDHAAVLLVSLFLALTSAALLNLSWLAGMYLSAVLLMIYLPLGKIRHCIYFFFSRRFFGLFIGRRAVMHPEAVK